MAKDSSGKAIPEKRDLERMEVEELIAENMRLGDLPEYAHHDIRQRRIEINLERDRKLAEYHAQIRREEAEGKRPPGQTIRL